jgi:hypothetical protein
MAGLGPITGPGKPGYGYSYSWNPPDPFVSFQEISCLGEGSSEDLFQVYNETGGLMRFKQWVSILVLSSRNSLSKIFVPWKQGMV